MFRKTKEKIIHEICSKGMKFYEADYLVKKGIAFREGNSVYMDRYVLKKHNIITLLFIRKLVNKING